MYKTLEILTEEPSMETFLEAILPQILPSGYVLGENCFIRSHEGKSHLQKSIPKKFVGYTHFPYAVKVLILHDQNSADCVLLKEKLIDLAGKNTSIPFLIRIPCRELENWYLGDFAAIEQVYPSVKASQLRNRAKYRNVDLLGGADDLKKLIGNFSKIETARNIAPQLNISANTSVSFQQFVSGLKKLLDPNFV
ncbi:MAG TPA: DUF4276 family protein [Bacteroidetes bacterium]|nr:DUF4276 family protein [Bacteroidota bacterium]